MYGFRNRNKKKVVENVKSKVPREEEKKEIIVTKNDDPSSMDNYKISKQTVKILAENGITKLFPI